jgi:hypothetical protein
MHLLSVFIQFMLSVSLGHKVTTLSNTYCFVKVHFRSLLALLEQEIVVNTVEAAQCDPVKDPNI